VSSEGGKTISPLSDAVSLTVYRNLVQPFVIGVPRSAYARADSEAAARVTFAEAVARGDVELLE
jgi:hypothetical protein